MNTSHTPKHFVLQLGALLGLYTSLTALLILLFSLINITFPDVTESYYMYDSAQSSARGAIATLIVFFPTYLVLTRLTNQQRRRETNGEYTTLTRWMVYLSLLLGGGILLADLVTLIMYFLNGELTVRFILKVIALFVVIGTAFTYYTLDIRGYFTKRVQQSLYCGLAALTLVGASVVWGFMNIETPSEVREARIDNEQVGDLQDMQWRIEDYYRSNDSLPATLADVYTVGEVPSAPAERSDYRYEITGKNTYQLCATFAETSQQSTSAQRLIAPPGLEKNYNWEHEAGEWCFSREIDNEYRQ